MERMQTRERKPRTTSDFSPPSSQLTKKPKKKQSQTKNKANSQKRKPSNEKSKPSNEKSKTNNEKSKTKNEKNKATNEKSKSKSQTKDESNKSIRTIEINNSIKEGQQQSPKSQKKKKGSTNSSTKIPDKLKIYVSQEIWNSWSNIRRDSFKQIIQNPNSFFYRNRPPGDPQKFGPFTSAEEKQFIDRLKYFREELGVNDGLWGYFSVPILGRVGYQCSNFYRTLIASGKIIVNSYEMMPDGKLRYLSGGTKIGGNKPPSKVMQILQDEALNFINKCFDNAKEGEVPQVLKPIVVKQEPKKNKNEKNETSDSEKETRTEDESESEKDGIFIEIGKSNINQSSTFLKNNFDSSAINNGKKRTSISTKNQNEFDFSGSRARRTRKSSFYDKSMIGSKGSYRDGRNKSSYGYPYSNTNHYSYTSFCPLIGAIDPFSNLPIEKPMMDPKGVVMDRKSWKKIFKTNVLPPFDIAAFSMGDLIEINSYNFDEYRYYITNIVC
ncbi:hypothetical protein M9Y10_023983 [Tritrichomonas musculus]|uniref:Myb-like domain-containing protein n=1 Tax=Tritrichomonas musculus TaxID=1915356 RepID=A0ABR2KXQ1_9EUKA